VKFKNIYNFITYFKKIVIKSMVTKCEGKNNCKSYFEISQEMAQNSRRRKKKACDAKPAAR
jgi:hypothetical protein